MADRAVFSIALSVLLGLHLDTSVLAQSPRVAVIVHNRARVPDDLLSEARSIVHQIYKSAGVELVWFCANPALTKVVFQGTKVRIMIITRDAADRIGHPPDAVGFTPGSGQSGLAYILENRVRALARGYSAPPAAVLGATIAHELGHILLRSGHTTSGIMRPELNQSDFRRVATGDWRFAAIAAMEIRARLVEADGHLTASARSPYKNLPSNSTPATTMK